MKTRSCSWQSNSTCALLCLNGWSSLGLVRDKNVSAVTSLDEVNAQAELTRLGDMLKACYH